MVHPLLPLLKCLLVSACLLASARAWAQDLVVLYRDKPPYSFTENGKPSGFLMQRTADILRTAGLDARYQELPVRRITLDIQGNARPLCSPGWYRLPEREAFARFSLPIHRDKPHVVLTHSGSHAIVQAHRRLDDLVADTRLTLGVVEGVSYGPELDRAIARVAAPPMKAMVTPLQMAKMIAAQRADFMFIDQEDLAWLNQGAEFKALGLKAVELPDMPRGLQRFLMCSQLVDPAVMTRLNAAIRQLGLDADRP